MKFVKLSTIFLVGLCLYGFVFTIILIEHNKQVQFNSVDITLNSTSQAKPVHLIAYINKNSVEYSHMTKVPYVKSMFYEAVNNIYKKNMGFIKIGKTISFKAFTNNAGKVILKYSFRITKISKNQSFSYDNMKINLPSTSYSSVENNVVIAGKKPTHIDLQDDYSDNGAGVKHAAYSITATLASN